MKQNKNDSILCIGELIVFITSIFLLFNNGFLNNILRLAIGGVIAILFIVLSDSFKTIYDSKIASKLSWLLGAILITLVYYTAGKLNMLGPYLSLADNNLNIFYSTMAILVLVLSYLSSVKQHSRAYLLVVYAAMLVLIYYAGLSIGLNEGYAFVVITTILMLINIIKKEGFLCDFIKAMSLLVFFFCMYSFKDLEALPLALLYFVNLTNMLIVGKKDDNYSRVFLFLLVIVLYKAFSVVRLYEYKVFIVAALSLSEVVYSILNKNKSKVYDIAIKIFYNIFYLYALFNIQTGDILITGSICGLIFFTSIAMSIMKDKKELMLLLVKLVITLNLVLTSLNTIYVKTYPIYIALIINIFLLLIYLIAKKSKLKYELLALMIINILLVVNGSTLSIFEYFIGVLLLLVDYVIVILKNKSTGIKRVFINCLFIITNIVLLNCLDAVNTKYIIFAMLMFIVVIKSLDSEFMLLGALLAFLYTSIKYITGLDLGLLGFGLKEIIILCSIFIALRYVLRETKGEHEWVKILFNCLLIYNLCCEEYYMITLAIAIAMLVIGYIKDKKLYIVTSLLTIIIGSRILKSYIFLIILGAIYVLYALFNDEATRTNMSNMMKEAFEDTEEEIESDELPEEIVKEVQIEKTKLASYCTHCGNIMAPVDEYCRYCGQKK